MSANKHYGRQIVLSLFLTVFGILGLLFLASRFLLPHFEIDQQQVYSVLVRLFPLLLGLIMIEIGVLVARRRDEEIAEESDRLPPNAYDRPFYTLPGDDPSHLHTEDLTLAHRTASAAVVDEPIMEETIAPVVEVASPAPVAAPAPIVPVVEQAGPQAVPVQPEEEVELINTADFDTLLSVELENAILMEYDLTLVVIKVEEGPIALIANKLVMQSGDLAYSFIRSDTSIAMVLPFYNNEEARTFTLSLIESCEREFSPSLLKVGFASRAGRMIEPAQLILEAESASDRAD
ncbi:MAG: hypothetical protein GXY63_08000 [Spirochaetales bacterium]|nr:hypothetical protein [Spirochaetales bacterium]